MLKLAICLVILTYASGEFIFRPPEFRPFEPFIEYFVGPYRLCTYKPVDYNKCVHTVEVARRNAIPLQLECVQNDDRESCIRSVSMGSADMTVLNAHGYRGARKEALEPVIFAREDESSLTIAVVPRNITVVDLQEAPILVNQSNHRAFHAAAFFNLQRGHDICGFTKAFLGPYIRMEDSALYQPKDDEILVCANRLSSEFAGYKQCNVEAGLQRAVFVRNTVSDSQVRRMREVFETILQRFGPEPPMASSEEFNFFQTYEGHDNVILKKNTIAFDLQPTYRNGVNENIFNYLHCNDKQQPHDPRNLL